MTSFKKPVEPYIIPLDAEDMQAYDRLQWALLPLDASPERVRTMAYQAQEIFFRSNAPVTVDEENASPTRAACASTSARWTCWRSATQKGLHGVR
jgi:hypothetical protein